MENPLNFNPSPSFIMLMDINSCFATIEQQANPHIRGKPTVVAAFTTPKGCILASSIEAKKIGIKTGMRVMDGKAIYPQLIVLPPDPPKYRNIHLGFRELISEYTDDFAPKSIDEFVLNLEDKPCLREKTIKEVAIEFKKRIKKEIGDYITVSIGIAPNRYLAKVAAGIKKPDGLVEINRNNFKEVYSNLGLTQLTGIKERNALRLNSVGIFSVLDFYGAPIWKLRVAFHSINGLIWHTRLSGYETDTIDFDRKSYGNSVAIGISIVKKEEIMPILSNLVEKVGTRLRLSGYKARGVHIFILYKDGSSWHHGELTKKYLFDSRDIFKEALHILCRHTFEKLVRNIAVSVFGLETSGSLQLNFFEDMEKKENLTRAVDKINQKWGEFMIKPGRMLFGKQKVLDRIAFGGVKEL